MTDNRAIRITTKTILTEPNGQLTAEGARILSRIFLAVGGTDGANKVEEAKTVADTAKVTADTVTATVTNPTTGLTAVATTATAAETTANAVNDAITDGSTGLAATKTIADTASATAAAIDAKLTGLTTISGTYSATAGVSYDQTIMQALMDEVSALRAAVVLQNTELKA